MKSIIGFVIAVSLAHPGVYDMNLVQMRQALVEQSGMRGLVADADGADYSDKSGLQTNATYYINAGLRWLNTRWSYEGTRHRYTTTLAVGQHEVTIPDVSFVSRMDVTDGESRTRLEQRSEAFLREQYREDFDDVDTGRPLYWARAKAVQELLADPNISVAPSVDSAGSGILKNLPGQWQMQDSGDIAHYEDGVIFVDQDGSVFRLAQKLSTLRSPETVDVKIDASAGDYLVWFAWVTYDDNPDGGATLDVTTTQVVAAGSTVSVTIDHHWNGMYITRNDFDDDYIVNGVSVRPQSNPTYHQTPSITIPWFTLMPPADEAYTLNVFGDFKTADLSADTDTNFWTEAHPELVIRAARLQLELDGHRNISGLTAFQSQIEGELERMLAQEAHARRSGRSPGEAVRNG